MSANCAKNARLRWGVLCCVWIRMAALRWHVSATVLAFSCKLCAAKVTELTCHFTVPYGLGACVSIV